MFNKMTSRAQRAKTSGYYVNMTYKDLAFLDVFLTKESPPMDSRLQSPIRCSLAHTLTCGTFTRGFQTQYTYLFQTNFSPQNPVNNHCEWSNIVFGTWIKPYSNICRKRSKIDL